MVVNIESTIRQFLPRNTALSITLEDQTRLIFAMMSRKLVYDAAVYRHVDEMSKVLGHGFEIEDGRAEDPEDAKLGVQK